MTALSVPQRDRVRLAFLGCGQITRKHSRTLASLQLGVDCFYASRDAGKAKQYKTELKGSGSFDSYAAAIESPDIDAVFVVTPPADHLELTLAALGGGKHVLVEKPPFLQAADFDKVVRAGRKSGLQVMVAENYFYKPMAVKLREILARGEIGDILFIHVNATKLQRTGDWRDSAALSGGGALFEGGIHWVSLLGAIGLTPGRVRAARPGPRDGTERSMLVTLEYEEGAVATLALSWDLPALVNGLRVSRIYGTHGTLRFETNGLAALQTGRRTRLILPGHQDLAGYRAMFGDFLPAIEGNRPPRYNLGLARRDLTLIENAYRSAAR
jgi:UDP-N-acetylglucosamine 3-dehydrogenase